MFYFTMLWHLFTMPMKPFESCTETKMHDKKKEVMKMEQHTVSVTCFFFPSFQLPATDAHQSALATMVCDRAGQDRRGRQTLVDTHFLFPPVILLSQGSATLSASLVLLGTSSRYINTQEKLPALFQNMNQK